jgi:hypothetical protein
MPAAVNAIFVGHPGREESVGDGSSQEPGAQVGSIGGRDCAKTLGLRLGNPGKFHPIKPSVSLP